MNSAFYLAIARMPLATVAAIEFVTTIASRSSAYGRRAMSPPFSSRSPASFLLIGFQWSDDRLGVLLAVVNAALFGGYIVIGHAISRAGGASGIDRL